MSNKIAAHINHRNIGYEQFTLDVDACANWLSNNLDENGVRISIGLKNQYWHWVSLLAILKLGKECVSFLNHSQAHENLKRSISVWLVDEHQGHDGLELVFDPVQVSENHVENSRDRCKDQLDLDIHDSAKRLILTSGTTGKPKIVSLSADQIKVHLSETAWQVNEAVNDQTKLLHLMGIDTMGGFLMPLVTWIKGGTVLLSSISDEKSGIIDMPLYQSNLICAAPARLKSLLEQYPGVWPGREHRKVRIAGSRLHPLLRDAVLKTIGCGVQITYGSTELGGVSSCDSSVIDQDPGTAGKIFKDVTVQIVNRDGKLLPYGQVGIVRCKTKAMATAYADGEISNQFVEGWFYPGDLGKMSEDGWLSISGRNSDVINLGGHKISAVELETSLLNIKELQDVCVVSVNIHGTDEPTVAVVYKDGTELIKIRQKIESLLPANFGCHVVRVPSLPRNNMGKLLRSQISQKLTEMMGK